MRRRLLALLSVLALAALASAPAGANTAVPLTGFSRIVVDSAHSHIFVSSPSDAELAVMNADGTNDTTVALAAHAGAMVISGNTLYAAECGAGTIEEVNTATLMVTGSITSSIGSDCDMVLSAGRLWYADTTDHLTSIDPAVGASSEVVTTLGADGFLAATPAAPNQVVFATSDGITVFDVDSAGTATQHSHASASWSTISDLAINPNGTAAYVVQRGSAQIYAYNLPALTAQTPRALTSYPEAVAAAPDGSHIAGGAQTTGKAVYVYPTGSSTVSNSVSVAAGMQVEPRGLAFSADSKSVYVMIATAANSTAPTLEVIKASNLPGSLTIKRSKTPIRNGQAVTVTAHLGTSSTVKKVSIWRRVVGTTTWRLTKTGNVGTSGSLSFVAKPKYTTYYRATWAGDATHAQTTSAATGIAVHLVMTVATQGGYATTAGVRLYHYAASCPKAGHAGCPRFVAGSKPLTPGVVINAVVQAKSGGGWHTILSGHATAGKGGKLILTLFYKNRSLVGVPQRIRFSIARTARNLGNTSPWKQYRVTS